MKAICFLLLISVSVLGAPVKLQKTTNNRFLQGMGGIPFFWLNDTAWGLPKLSRPDIDRYLETRAAQGFNSVLIALKYLDTIAMPGGSVPFTGNNTDTPNATFFAHIDYIVSKANSLNLYVMITIMWSEDYVSLLGSDTAKADRLGDFLGARYAANDNVIWNIAGEYNHSASWNKPVQTAVAQGISDNDTGAKLTTVHPSSFLSTSQDWQAVTLVDFNVTQTSHWIDNQAHSQLENYEIITNDWNNATTKPIADGEFCYEGLPEGFFASPPGGTVVTSPDIRRKAYWGTFAGAFGTTYGHAATEMMNQPGDPDAFGASIYWYDALTATGATQMIHLKNLMRNKLDTTRIPDQSIITAGGGTGLAHVRATRDSLGSWLMVYIPQGGSITVDMTKVAGPKAHAYWYNPRDGSTTDIGVYANTGTQSFDPAGATANGNDWVLVIEQIRPLAAPHLKIIL